MPAKSARGVKRKCQNEECLAPFYDLERTEFDCPVCGTTFDHELDAKAQEPQPSRYPSRKQPRVLPIVASEEPEQSPEEVSEEDVVAEETGEDADTEETTAESSDVLLEDEEDDNLADTIEIPKVNEGDEA